MKHSAFLFSFFCFCLAGHAAVNDTTFLKEDAHQVIAHEKYFFTKDNLTIQQLITQRFLPKDSVYLQYINGFLWLKFVVQNKSTTNRFVLGVTSGHISGLYLYKPTPTGYYMTPPKLHDPEDGREVYNRRPAFFLELEKGETKTFYLKIQVENEWPDMGYIICNYTRFAEYIQADYIILGLYFGALLMIIALNIYYFISLKDRLFLIYAIYAFGTFLSSATIDGFAWLLIPDTDVAYHVSYFCFRFWVDAMLFFTIHLVNLKQHYKGLTTVAYLYLCYHSILMPILGFIDVFHMRANYTGQWEGVNCLISMLLAFIIVILSYKDNKYLFKYYIAAISVLMILVPLFAFGIPNEYLVKTGTVIEMIILSFAVSQRFKLTEKQLKHKKEQEQVLNDKVKQLEMDIRKTQMNPHFMTNALTSIEYFILSNDSVQARGYLNKFSRLMRLMLDHSRNNFVSLYDELEALRLYLELEFLRLQSHEHHFEITTGKNTDCQSIFVPPLLIQPLVENAIWHGLQNRKNGGKLLVDVTLMHDRLQCTIEDNGTGIQTELIPKDHKSSGMFITKERLSLIHAILNTPYKFEIDDKIGEQRTSPGTRIQFNIPYINGDF
jgi:sensor histidine kinase YesM